MTASNQELQELTDRIFEILGVRMKSGQLVIHFNDAIVMRWETTTVHRPPKALDKREN